MIVEILTLISILYIGFSSVILFGFISRKKLNGLYISIILLLSTITILILLRGVSW